MIYKTSRMRKENHIDNEQNDQVDPYVLSVVAITGSAQPTHSNMNWYNWYFEVLKKYAVFRGKTWRKEHWTFTFFNFIIIFVISFVEEYG